MSASQWHEPIDLEEDWLVAVFGDDSEEKKKPLHHPVPLRLWFLWLTLKMQKEINLKVNYLSMIHQNMKEKNKDKWQCNLAHSSQSTTSEGSSTTWDYMNAYGIHLWLMFATS